MSGARSRIAVVVKGYPRLSETFIAQEILGLVAERHDITLSEIASHLERRHGARFAQSTVWRFFDRHAMTFKKNRARQRAGASRRRRAKTGLARHPGRA